VGYQPPGEYIERYADVLVNFALNAGRGMARGDVVMISSSDAAKPLYVALRDAVLRSGGTTIGDYSPGGSSRSAVEIASMEQLSTFHRAYYRGLAATIDHRIAVIATDDPHQFEGIDPKKLLIGRRSIRPYREWIAKKEAEGRYSWTLGLYGTPAMAKEARLSLERYWGQIVQACFLDDPNPIKRWREAFAEINRVKRRLNKLEVERIHVEGDGIDLRITVGPTRRWLGATGHNIPSFEIFTSPDWRGTEGTVSFTEPLHRYGSMIEGVKLRFERGLVVEATATRSEHLLQAMIESDEGSRRVGEVSLTDGRLSRINTYMAETLYDENRGGPQGNFHLALGSAYRQAFTGEIAAQTKRDWRRLGFNESSVHTDIVSTARRHVTALLPSGRSKVIYADGQFTV
jgi:aminopeptidase